MSKIQNNKNPIMLIVVIAFAMFIGWRVISLGLADYFAEQQPHRALFWRADHPIALFRAAELALKDKQLLQAQQFAKRALQANPLDGRSLRILAEVAEQQGDIQRARDFYQKAVVLAPRDLISHAWLLDDALRRQQAKPAVQHLDALLRLQPTLIQSLQAQADVLAVNPLTQVFMIKSLAEMPTWRRAFLNSFSKADMPLDAMAGLYNGLVKQSGLEVTEYQPWLARLIKEHRYMQAYVTWAQLIPENQRKYLGNVFDGGFEVPQEEQFGNFAWITRHSQGVQMYWARSRGVVGETAFLVNFDGGRTPFSNLQQLLVLPPGKWHLNYRAKANRLDSERGLIWRISCLDNGSTLAETSPMRGMFDWQEFSLEFSIPAECGGQSLTLMIPARIAAETQIQGDLWLDEVSIQPTETKL